MPNNTPPGQGPASTRLLKPKEDKSAAHPLKNVAYSPSDAVIIIDAPIKTCSPSSYGPGYTPEKSAVAAPGTTSIPGNPFPKGLSRVKKSLFIITKLLEKQEVTERLPSTGSIIMAARSQFNFFPSRLEVIEARSLYKELHPQIIDDETCQRSHVFRPLELLNAGQSNQSENVHGPQPYTSPPLLKSENVNQPNQAGCAQAPPPDVCRLTLEFGSYKISVQGPLTQELEQIVQSARSILGGDRYDG